MVFEEAFTYQLVKFKLCLCLSPSYSGFRQPAINSRRQWKSTSRTATAIEPSRNQPFSVAPKAHRGCPDNSAGRWGPCNIRSRIHVRRLGGVILLAAIHALRPAWFRSCRKKTRHHKRGRKFMAMQEHTLTRSMTILDVLDLYA